MPVATLMHPTDVSLPHLSDPIRVATKGIDAQIARFPRMRGGKHIQTWAQKHIETYSRHFFAQNRANFPRQFGLPRSPNCHRAGQGRNTIQNLVVWVAIPILHSCDKQRHKGANVKLAGNGVLVQSPPPFPGGVLQSGNLTLQCLQSVITRWYIAV